MASALDPSVGGREMIFRHMESHYRRVSAVKGRVDSSAPDALVKSVRVRDRRRREALVKNSKLTKTKTVSLRPESPSPTHITSPNLSQQDESVLESPRWAGYHTKTGRTTAQYGELRRARDHRDVDPSWVQHPSPWKPAFELQPLFKPDSPNGCSTPRTSPPVRRKSPNATSPSVSPRLPTAESGSEIPDKHVQFNDKTLFKDTVHLTATYNIDLPSSRTDQYRQLPDFATYSENDQTSPIMTTATQRVTFRKTDNKSSTIPHYRFHVAEKNFERRTKLGESVLELAYLRFLSAITRDILTKRQFSDAGIKVLIQSHVAANRHTLREDIMWQRIAVLKRDLGLITYNRQLLT